MERASLQLIRSESPSLVRCPRDFTEIVNLATHGNVFDADKTPNPLMRRYLVATLPGVKVWFSLWAGLRSADRRAVRYVNDPNGIGFVLFNVFPFRKFRGGRIYGPPLTSIDSPAVAATSKPAGGDPSPIMLDGETDADGLLICFAAAGLVKYSSDNDTGTTALDASGAPVYAQQDHELYATLTLSPPRGFVDWPRGMPELNHSGVDFERDSK